MAYVAISSALKNQIQGRMNTMRLQEMERLKATLYPPQLKEAFLAGPEWAACIEKVAWGAHTYLRESLPEEWIVRAERIDVHFKDGERELETFQFRDPANYLTLPPHFRHDYVGDIEVDVAQFYDAGVGEAYRRYHQADVANTERYEQAWEQLKTLLERCKSLNEAVEIYPDLKFFLDDEVKEKLEKKRVKDDKPDPRLEGVDTALITSAAVLWNLNKGQE